MEDTTGNWGGLTAWPDVHKQKTETREQPGPWNKRSLVKIPYTQKSDSVTTARQTGCRAAALQSRYRAHTGKHAGTVPEKGVLLGAVTESWPGALQSGSPGRPGTILRRFPTTHLDVPKAGERTVPHTVGAADALCSSKHSLQLKRMNCFVCPGTPGHERTRDSAA